MTNKPFSFNVYGVTMSVDFKPYCFKKPYDYGRMSIEMPWWVTVDDRGSWMRTDHVWHISHSGDIGKLDEAHSLAKVHDLVARFNANRPKGNTYKIRKWSGPKSHKSSSTILGHIDIYECDLNVLFSILDKMSPMAHPNYYPGQVWLMPDGSQEMVTGVTSTGQLSESCQHIRESGVLLYGPSRYGLNVPWVDLSSQY